MKKEFIAQVLFYLQLAEIIYVNNTEFPTVQLECRPFQRVIPLSINAASSGTGILGLERVLSRHRSSLLSDRCWTKKGARKRIQFPNLSIKIPRVLHGTASLTQCITTELITSDIDKKLDEPYSPGLFQESLFFRASVLEWNRFVAFM